MKNEQLQHWILDTQVKDRTGPLVTHQESVNCHSCPTYPASIKCCTYEPFIGNFVIGRHIELFMKYLDQDLSFWPMGFYPNFQLKQKIEENPSLFGQDDKLVCRYFKQGACSVWVARGVVCLSYYCLHDHGQQGRLAWKKQEESLLILEAEMTQEILARMAYPSKLIEPQLKWDALAKLTESKLTQLYNESWQATGYSSKTEFFLQCYKHYINYQSEG